MLEFNPIELIFNKLKTEFKKFIIKIFTMILISVLISILISVLIKYVKNM